MERYRYQIGVAVTYDSGGLYRVKINFLRPSILSYSAVGINTANVQLGYAVEGFFSVDTMKIYPGSVLNMPIEGKDLSRMHFIGEHEFICLGGFQGSKLFYSYLELIEE